MAKDMGLASRELDGSELDGSAENGSAENGSAENGSELHQQGLAPDRSAQQRSHGLESLRRDSFGRLPSDRRSPDAMLQQLSPDLRAALTLPQLDELRGLLAEALPRPQPKILDIRFGINLLFDRYYLVLFMGKDQRRRSRQTRFSRLSNWLTAALLLLSLNVFVSLTLAMALYLVKSAAGIDLFPGHLSDRVQSL